MSGLYIDIYIYIQIYIHHDPKKTGPPNTLSYNAIISQYSFKKFYEMIEVKDCKQ